VALSAGQFMEFAEKLAVKAATGQAVTATTTLWMALLTAAPVAGTDLTMAAETEYMGGTANGYARQPITTATGWNAATSASPSVVSNGAVLTWGPTSTSPGTTVTWGMLVDAVSLSSANNWIAYLLTTPRTPISGDSVAAAISAFTCSV
jgi:hypothetical protein